MNSTAHSGDRLEERVTQLERQLEGLQQALPQAVIENMSGHASAKLEDARAQYNIGETARVVIEEITEGDSGQEGVSHLQGIVVFVDLRGLSATVGETVAIKITDVKSSVIHGLALNTIDTGDVRTES